MCIKLFADDIKIYLEIVSESDLQLLQHGINQVSIWAETWQLKLATNKCQHMRIGLVRSFVSCDYLLNNNVLSSSKCCHGIGIDIDSHLKFS